MKAELLKKMLTGKSKILNIRMNPALLDLLDDSIKKDKDFKSRNELIEVLILRYLESKGKL